MFWDDIKKLKERTRFTGPKFEAVMTSLPENRRTSETAETVMLMARVTEMDDTVATDLGEESTLRLGLAEQHEGEATILRSRATRQDDFARQERSRAGVVQSLMALLGDTGDNSA